MERGFVIEYAAGPFGPDKWHPGAPVEKEFVGLKMGTYNIDLNLARPIATYRCTNCGYLESYCK